jgi:hypothetical protein
VPDTEWERVDRAIGGQTFVMWVLRDGPEAPFRVWPPLDPVRTVGATFDGFISGDFGEAKFRPDGASPSPMIGALSLRQRSDRSAW